MIPSALLPRAQAACAAAIAAWGPDPQFRKAIEEACELGAALSHLLEQRPTGLAEAVEETADVAICLVQLRMMLGPEVDRVIEEKLGRLEARMRAARDGVVVA